MQLKGLATGFKVIRVPYSSRICRQDDSSSVSVFFFDGSLPNKRNLLPIAKNALRKLRTIRHPDVLKFIDAVETETTIYIVTERIQPLGKALTAWSSKPANAREEWLIWGLQRISVSLIIVLYFTP